MIIIIHWLFIIFNIIISTTIATYWNYNSKLPVHFIVIFPRFLVFVELKNIFVRVSKSGSVLRSIWLQIKEQTTKEVEIRLDECISIDIPFWFQL